MLGKAPRGLRPPPRMLQEVSKAASPTISIYTDDTLDLHIDEDGRLSSRSLDVQRAKYDHRQYQSRCGEPDDE